MKKTLNINLGGIGFTINEDAYNTLQEYLEKIRKSLGQMEGIDEVMADIELRIADIFQEKVTAAKSLATSFLNFES